jgi:hypothetical protein
MATKRMGGMSLGDFKNSGTVPSKAIPVKPEPLPAPELTKTIQKHPPAATPKEKPITVNIKITRSQHDWLNETSRQVRENNDEPVPAADRVYPQHLIGVALDLLKGADIDWGTVANVQDLRKQLNI